MSEQSKSEDQGVDSLDFDKRNVLYIMKSTSTATGNGCP